MNVRPTHEESSPTSALTAAVRPTHRRPPHARGVIPYQRVDRGGEADAQGERQEHDDQGHPLVAGGCWVERRGHHYFPSLIATMVIGFFFRLQ
jgi:hypothetical protein